MKYRRSHHHGHRAAAGVTVPTMDDFTALAARVTALEQGSVTPPEPEPIPPPTNGTQCKRIASLIERFGINTFSSMDSGNRWGSWPADYRPESVIAALDWLLQDSGFSFGLREYHYKGRESWQRPWFQQIKAAYPNMRNMMCPGANASVADVPSMLAMQQDPSTGVVWAEGINEANTDFGSGEVPYEVTYDIQEAVWADGTRGALLGPSIVAGTPHPEGWILGYCESQANLDELNGMMDIGNGHYYPPGSPDVPNTGYSVNEYVGGLWGAYAKHPIALPEFHPTLYNSQGNNPGKPGWSGKRDSYYTATTLFRCAQNGTHSVWWYAMFDYGSTYRCGLFPINGYADPREDAYALRALCWLCADRGDNRRTFDPGKFDYTVSGGDSACSTDLYQGSDGVIYIALWRSLPEPGGAAIPLSFDFPSKPGRIEEFDITRLAADKVASGYVPVQVNTTKDGKLTSQLDGSARIIRIVQ
jgi:hypothetical protein